MGEGDSEQWGTSRRSSKMSGVGGLQSEVQVEQVWPCPEGPGVLYRWDLPPPHGQKDTTVNITFPQLRWRAGESRKHEILPWFVCNNPGQIFIEVVHIQQRSVSLTNLYMYLNISWKLHFISGRYTWHINQLNSILAFFHFQWFAFDTFLEKYRSCNGTGKTGNLDVHFSRLDKQGICLKY